MHDGGGRLVREVDAFLSEVPTARGTAFLARQLLDGLAQACAADALLALGELVDAHDQYPALVAGW